MSKFIVYAHTPKEQDRVRDGFTALLVSESERLGKPTIHKKIQEAELAQTARQYTGDLQAGSFNYVIVADAPNVTSALKQAQHQGLVWESKKECLTRYHTEARRKPKVDAKPTTPDVGDDFLKTAEGIVTGVVDGLRKVSDEFMRGFRGDDKPGGPKPKV